MLLVYRVSSGIWGQLVPVVKVAQQGSQAAADGLEYDHNQRRSGVALMTPTVATGAALK
jgi:hypothetical protein